jgi:hypothetical protein
VLNRCDPKYVDDANQENEDAYCNVFIGEQTLNVLCKEREKVGDRSATHS